MAALAPACASCRAVPEVGARFCGACGARLPEAPLFDDDDGPPTRPQEVPGLERGKLAGAGAPAQAIPDTVISKAPAFATTPAMAAPVAAPAVAPQAAP